MVKISSMLGATAALVLMTISSHAATLTDITGDIKLNQGSGFEVVTGTIEVKPGDKVMAGPEASATVIYSNGIGWKLKPGRVMTISTDKVAKIRSQAMFQQAPPVIAPPPAIPVVALAVGGAAVAATVAVVVNNAQKEEDTPPSP